MRSEALGRSTLGVEVTNISKHGIWLMVDEEEYFLPFSGFPWFKSAALDAVFRIERPHPHHLYWPDLDVDLTVESIRHPDKYPLISKGNAEPPGGADRH